MLFSYFLFNFIVLYIILKLRPQQTQNFLNVEISWVVPEILKKKKNRKILKLRFFEKIGRFKKFQK